MPLYWISIPINHYIPYLVCMGANFSGTAPVVTQQLAGPPPVACFEAPAEVLTDQRREFLGSFVALYTMALIDHRTTSRDLSEADGLAERVVQTVKRGLRKYRLLHGNHGDWDLMLPWIAIASRFCRKASLAT